MVFVRRQVDPALKQAKINISLSASPTLSLSDPGAVLRLTLTLSIASAARGREGNPLTFCTERSVFEAVRPGDGGIDVFARRGFGQLCSATGDPQKHISLGYFHVSGRDKSDSPDLREREYRFVTVPGGGGGGEGEEHGGGTSSGSSSRAGPSVATITHGLDWERILRYEEKRKREDLVPGERFEVILKPGFVGTLWWCWGDLETDLKDKRLHMWHGGRKGEERPDDDFLSEGNWVLGEDPALLDWEDVTEGGKTSFEIVE